MLYIISGDDPEKCILTKYVSECSRLRTCKCWKVMTPLGVFLISDSTLLPPHPIFQVYVTNNNLGQVMKMKCYLK